MQIMLRLWHWISNTNRVVSMENMVILNVNNVGHITNKPSYYVNNDDSI